ncbi:hypothetical protein [Bradyrhizobium elkanii]|uniref:hypothetical protein n=1 Tax=Bradyrhizobium elkanii TaxID=29448 RepID=UPI003D258441
MSKMTKLNESTIRSRARAAGYRVQKSRRAWSIDNYGDYMLIDDCGVPMLGYRYDASLEEVADFLAEDAQ